jgi:hypothetical protein
LQRGDPQTPGVSCDEVSTITSDVYKSSGLTNRRHVPLGPSTEIHGRPGGYHRQWQRAEGDAGKPIVSILRYRSRGSNRCPSSLLLDRTNFPVEALGALDIIDVNTEEPGIESELNNTIPNQSLGIQDIIGQDTRVKVEPDMSSTPSEDSDIPNRSPSKGPAPEPSSPSQMVSLLSDDEDCYKPATPRPTSYAPTVVLSDDEDDDDGVDPATSNSANHDATKQNFSSSARPTMSPTPSQAARASSQMTLETSVPQAASARPKRSLLPDKDGDNEDQDSLFPFYSSENVRKQFLRATGNSDHNDDEDEDGDDTGSAGDDGTEGELVGPGHATPPRYRNETAQRLGEGTNLVQKLSERPRKRTLSEVVREEEQLEVEEAAAAAERQKRKSRREEIEAAKRRLIEQEIE